MDDIVAKILGPLLGGGVVSGVLVAVARWWIKKHLQVLKENNDLHAKLQKNELDAVKLEIAHRAEILDLKFQDLRADVTRALNEGAARYAEQRKLYEKVTAGILRWQHQSEKRFEDFQDRLVEYKLLCDRIRKKG